MQFRGLVFDYSLQISSPWPNIVCFSIQRPRLSEYFRVETTCQKGVWPEDEVAHKRANDPKETTSDDIFCVMSLSGVQELLRRNTEMTTYIVL